MDIIKKHEANLKRFSENDYAEKIVCFLDILGFSHKSKGSKKPSDMGIVVTLKLDEDTIRKCLRHVQIHQFADSLVLATDANHVNILFEIIAKNIYQIIYEERVICEQYGVKHQPFLNNTEKMESLNLIRGGITFGKIYMLDEKIVTDEHGSQDVLPAITFGPAVSVAHDLEYKVAKYPRIIIDDNVYQQIRNNSDILEYIATDVDKQKYFDFIRYLKTECAGDWDNIEMKLNKVARYIKSHLFDICEAEKCPICLKQKWMLNYITRNIDFERSRPCP